MLNFYLSFDFDRAIRSDSSFSELPEIYEIPKYIFG